MSAKLRNDSLEAELVAAGKRAVVDQLEQWLFEEHKSYSACLGLLQSQFGYRPKGSRTRSAQIHRIYAFYHRKLGERSVRRLTQSKELADMINALGSQGALDEATLKSVSALTLNLSAQENPDIKSLAELVKVVLKSREHQLDREKFELLKAKAAQADAAKEVTQSAMTPEEKEAEYRRIFAIAK
jgi:hypothetical protein